MAQANRKAAAIYIRVSTDAQFEEGYSVDAQREQLSAYCVSKGIKNYEYYIDGGWSGSNMDRPQLQRLIADVKDNRISHCVVYKLDRLSRSQKDTLYLIEDIFNPYGVVFVSLNETMDTSTPMGRLMLGILSAFAQLERENIRLRTRMGMKERVKDGYWMGGGRVPYGYDYDKNQGILVPNRDAEKVRKIYELYMEGYSGQSIADMVGLKYDKLALQILKRKSNYGIIEYNGEEYQGRHEPIISKETYDTAMAIMAKRSMGRIKSAEHLLTGMVYCGRCGAKMRYQNWGKGGCKLMCYSQQTSKAYLVKDPGCVQEKLWADDVEDIVVKKLLSLKERERGTESREEKFATVIQILNNQQEELERKIRRLYNLFSESEDDLLLDTINENKKKLEEIKERIRLEIDQNTLTANRSRITETLRTLEDKWDYMTKKEKQTIVRTLVERVTITGENIEIVLSV